MRNEVRTSRLTSVHVLTERVAQSTLLGPRSPGGGEASTLSLEDPRAVPSPSRRAARARPARRRRPRRLRLVQHPVQLLVEQRPRGLLLGRQRLGLRHRRPAPARGADDPLRGLRQAVLRGRPQAAVPGLQAALQQRQPERRPAAAAGQRRPRPGREGPRARPGQRRDRRCDRRRRQGQERPRHQLRPAHHRRRRGAGLLHLLRQREGRRPAGHRAAQAAQRQGQEGPAGLDQRLAHRQQRHAVRQGRPLGDPEGGHRRLHDRLRDRHARLAAGDRQAGDAGRDRQARRGQDRRRLLGQRRHGHHASRP